MKQLTKGFAINVKTKDVGLVDQTYYKDYDNKKDLTAYITHINNTDNTTTVLVEKQHDWVNLERPLPVGTSVDTVCTVQAIQIETLFDMIYELQAALSNARVQF